MGRTTVDLTGRKFGRWTVLSQSQRRANDGALFWHCKCDCGATREVLGTNMKNGQSLSCGCERIEKTRAAIAASSYRGNIFEDLTSRIFGRWTVISRAHKTGKIRFWLCRCLCGTERFVAQTNLKGGRTQSCGCLHKELTSKGSFKHGVTGSIYNSWSSMKERCLNPKSDSWKDYGGRGIKICERWMHFEGFFEDMGPTWHRGLSLERDNVNGNYEPANCRWATRQEQSRNTRKSVMIDTPWGRMNVCDAADHSGINRQTLIKRIRRGWSMDKIFDSADFRRKEMLQ